MSNQVADWLYDVPEVREFVKRSKLYMLGQRREVLIRNFELCERTDRIKFDLVCGSIEANNLEVELTSLIGDYSRGLSVDFGCQYIKIFDDQDGILYWATTDKLLYDSWRGIIHIHNLTNIREFTTFELYYVGISKANDSFHRIFNDGHKKRTKILTNETQLDKSARLTDEIYIFLFDVEQVGIKELKDGDYCMPSPLDKAEVIADAEKALIKIMDCKYNDVKYKKYPAGVDGLSASELTGYSYIVGEDLTFNVSEVQLRGVYNCFQHKYRQPDAIVIQGDSVEFISPDWG